MAEIQRITVRHEAIMDYLLANPTQKLGDVARHFNMTQGWLSQVIHSDAFQALLSEKQNIIFHESVLPLREKMMNVAHLALDRLSETLPMETETRTLSQVAESVLDRLGFSPKNPGQGNVTEVNLSVSVVRSEVEEARQFYGTRNANKAEVLVNGVRAPIGLSGACPSPVGETFEGTAFRIEEALHASAKAGS
jgi:hypothetical protein